MNMMQSRIGLIKQRYFRNLADIDNIEELQSTVLLLAIYSK
jgi:hypothetical protein